MKINIVQIVLILFFVIAQCSQGEPMKKTIMIDLDGVLDEYTHYTNEIPPIKKGTKEFVAKLSKEFELILFTTRSAKEATKWLIDNKIDKYFKDVTNVKFPAYIYLDDRSIKFNGDYEKALDEIKNFQVYWKNIN